MPGESTEAYSRSSALGRHVILRVHQGKDPAVVAVGLARATETDRAAWARASGLLSRLCAGLFRRAARARG